MRVDSTALQGSGKAARRVTSMALSSTRVKATTHPGLGVKGREHHS